MDEIYREKIALFRYGIIAPLVTASEMSDKERTGFFRDASLKTYTNPGGKAVTYSEYTIRRYYRNYQADGLDGLKPERRSDCGHSRKMDDDIRTQISYLHKEYPRLPCTLIYQKLVDNHTIREGDISLSTITRYVNNLKRQENYVIKEFRRYELEHINEVWYGDSSVGPYLKIGKEKKKVWIIALIDDASRFIVGIDVFFNDNFVNLMSVIRSAVIKFGKPKTLKFDNGANYRSHQMELLGARMGTTVNYAPPYTPTGKAKIERWFRTMKDQWMAKLNMHDFESLDDLRDSLMHWVQKYNQSPHSSLDGRTPQDRFFEESSLIIRMDEERIEKTFLLETERRVSRDNVITLEDKEYEVNYKYAGQKLLLRYSPDLSKIYSVDRRNGELEEIKLLDKKANSTFHRTSFKMSGGN